MGIYQKNCDVVLQRSVDSILNQTFENFEFIICDDACPEEVSGKLRLWAGEDSRIILIRNEENAGLAASLNRCLSLARSRYIARMDSDDSSEPNRLERLYQFLEKHPEYALAGSNAKLIDEDGVWGVRRMKERPLASDFLMGSPFIHPSVMMRREVYAEMRGYRQMKEVGHAEDYDLFMRVYQAGYRGCNIQETLYRYREDSASYLKYGLKDRLKEIQVRFRGFSRLRLMPYGGIYCIKPLLAGIMPPFLRARLHRLRYGTKNGTETTAGDRINRSWKTDEGIWHK